MLGQGLIRIANNGSLLDRANSFVIHCISHPHYQPKVKYMLKSVLFGLAWSGGSERILASHPAIYSPENLLTKRGATLTQGSVLSG